MISATTTYYVAATAGGGGISTVGAANTSISGTLASQTTTSAGINFDVLAPSVSIISMDIYPTAAIGSAFTITVKQGTNVIASYSGTTTVQGTTTVPVVQTVPVNFVIPNGTGYQVTLPTNPGVIRNEGGDAFPYTVADQISLTSSSLSGYYYYLYNWVISSGCSSSRTAVVATVTPAPAITVSASPAAICAGESTQLSASSSEPNYSYLWTPGNLSGATQTVSPSVTTTYTVEANETVNGCSATGTVTVTVYPLPTPVVVSPATAVAGTIQQLVATGGTSGGDFVFGTATTTNATTGYPSPYSNYYGGSKHQMLIRASELQAAGLVAGSPVQSLAFSVTAVGTTFSGNLSDFQISLKNTTTNVLTSTSFESGLTLVYGPLTQPIPTTGLPAVVTHTITPFVWDGTSNLIIETSYSNANSGTSTDFVQMYNSDPGFVSTNWYRADAVTAAAILAAATPTSSGNARPNVVIGSTLTNPITWSPITDLFTDDLATIPYTGDARTTVYANPASAVTYTATATSSNGCESSGTCEFTATKELVMKLFLEGLYNGASAMNQAFDDLGPHFPAGVADQVTLELRDGTTGDLVYTLSNVNLGTNGFINATIPSVHNGSYYIYVYHRNSITTSTAVPVSFAGESIAYDLTIVASSAYGDNMKYMNEVFVIYGGDVNQDGLVDSSDMIAVDNDAANFAAGYIATDVTGDGLVDSSDMILIDNNSGLFISTVVPF